MKTVLATVLLLGMSLPAFAEAALDLASYDCSLPEKDQTVRGDELLKQGYQLANRARFGDVNLMMINPKSSALVNCFKRPEGAR
ncbi:hypothetical protein ACIKTA_12420 [Hansschlegelia beijingensis]